MKVLRKISIFVLWTSLLPAQIVIDGVLRDTSYTIYSAAKKIHKQYPLAEIITPNKDLNIIEQMDISYIRRGNRELKLDLFRPKKNVNNYATVILVHGGGWVTGDKSLMVPMAQELSSRGYVTAVIEYRLAAEAKYPAAIHDIKAAVKWMRTNAEIYSVDTNKIALLGCSAGGQLAAFVGATNGISMFDDTSINFSSSSIVNAVVDVDGILDFTDPAESGKDLDPSKPSVGKRWLGSAYKDNPKVWVEASPLTHVNHNSAPISFINSSLDRFHAGRDEMIEKLNKHKIYSVVYSIEDSPHSFWLFKPWYSATMDNVVQYLKIVFKL
jgi:acetyl esterase/lipase